MENQNKSAQNMSIQVQQNEQTGVVQFNFFDPSQFEVMQRVSKMFASSELVPEMYRISPKNTADKAMANCMIAIDVAQRIGASPLMVMQNMYIVYGKPAWSSKFLIATINTCGRFNPLQFKFENLGKVGKIGGVDYPIDNIECIAFTTARNSKDILESSPISISMAIHEGWYVKNGSKWKTLTRQMLMYRAASFWTSVYAPELSMGMKTEYEVMDIEDVQYEDISDKANKQVVDFDQPDPVDTKKEEEKVPDKKESKKSEQKSDKTEKQEAPKPEPPKAEPGESGNPALF